MEKRSYEQRARIIVNKAQCEPVVSKYLKKLLEYDERTFMHCCNVSFLVVQMGLIQSFDESRILELAIGSLLHDIGKLEIDKSILRKKSTLTDAEMVRMREHAELGYQMLLDEDIPFISKQIVRYHHERLDGSGYPKGLIEAQIPMEVRFVSTADVYDAMTSERPYKKEFSGSYAIEELKEPLTPIYDDNAIRLLINCMDR